MGARKQVKGADATKKRKDRWQAWCARENEPKGVLSQTILMGKNAKESDLERSKERRSD